jgi:2-polyprenyl-3-methyl-5-hydroxy-6-metoxy-1,4-benzoquinol methylase
MSTWLDFWQQKNEFDESMSMNYRYFLDHVEAHVSLTPQTRVLDIGSGPGHLADAWQGRVGRLVGLDISQRYNDLVRTRHARHPNVVTIDLDATNYLDFSAIAGQQFDVIVVMSVVQYYRNAAEVEQLLTNIRAVAAPGATALLCDLIVKPGMLGDIVSAMWRSLKQGQLVSMLGLMVRLRLSAYYRTRQQNDLLAIPEADWLQMCNTLTLNARFLPEPLTLQHDRQNLLIRF